MAANNGDVVIADWSGGPRHTRVRVHAYRSLWLTPKKTPGTYGWILFPWLLGSVNRGVSDQAALRRC